MWQEERKYSDLDKNRLSFHLLYVIWKVQENKKQEIKFTHNPTS
jgi:hypothetical protein